jgi:hypothetical protein
MHAAAAALQPQLRRFALNLRNQDTLFECDPPVQKISITTNFGTSSTTPVG